MCSMFTVTVSLDKTYGFFYAPDGLTEIRCNTDMLVCVIAAAGRSLVRQMACYSSVCFRPDLIVSLAEKCSIGVLSLKGSDAREW